MLLIAIPTLILAQAQNTLSACALSLDRTDVYCADSQTGIIEVEFASNETGTFTLNWVDGPTSIPTTTYYNNYPGFPMQTIATFDGLLAGYYFLEVTTPSGGICLASATIIALDFSPPIIICPQDTVVFADPGTCGIIVEPPMPTIIDACSTTITSTTGQNGETIYTVTDSNGNTATGACNADVIVVDGESPTINCPSDISTTITNGACSTSITWGITASDNCGINNVSSICFTIDGVVFPCASGSQYPIGTTTILNTATDISGNTSSCIFTIAVSDNTTNNLFFTGTIADDVYHVRQDIIANGDVPTSGNVGFKAGECIKLDEGFTVQPGADFSGEIDDCNTP